MKRILSVILIGFLGLFFSFSCSPELKLSNKEAQVLIEQHFKYPIVEYKWCYLSMESNPDMYQKANQWIREGNFFAIKPKRNNDNSMFAYLACYKQSIKKIEEVLIDSKTNTSIVTYSVGFEPIEPNFSFAHSYFPENTKRKVTFKKFDKGWRIVSEKEELS